MLGIIFFAVTDSVATTANAEYPLYKSEDWTQQVLMLGITLCTAAHNRYKRRHRGQTRPRPEHEALRQRCGEGGEWFDGLWGRDGDKVEGDIFEADVDAEDDSDDTEYGVVIVSVDMNFV